MTRQRLTGLLLLGLFLSGLGCAHPAKIAFRYDENGTPTAYCRRERHLKWDLIHHVRRQVYFRPSANLVRGLSADQLPIVEQQGEPDWVRGPFRSLDDESVVEWLYLDRARTYQFIHGALVFEGPLTDYEQVLLRRGYPTHAVTGENETGNQVEMFTYSGVFMPSLDEYHFVNGTLNQMQKGN